MQLYVQRPRIRRLFYNERLKGGNGNIRLITTEFRNNSVVFRITSLTIHIYEVALGTWIVGAVKHWINASPGLLYDSVFAATGRTNLGRRAKPLFPYPSLTKESSRGSPAPKHDATKGRVYGWLQGSVFGVLFAPFSSREAQPHRRRRSDARAGKLWASQRRQPILAHVILTV